MHSVFAFKTVHLVHLVHLVHCVTASLRGVDEVDEVDEGREEPNGQVAGRLPQCATMSVVSGPDGRGIPPGMSRKVRAPQGRVLRNAKAGRPDGKWHRNDTAQGVSPDTNGKGEKVR